MAARGTVKGNIVAEDKVELGPEARVEGDITCQTLVVAEGAMFCGRSLMGEPPLEGGKQTAPSAFISEDPR